MRCRTLYLDPAGLSAYRRQSNGWLSETHFSLDSAGNDDFAKYLQTHRQSFFRLLINLPEEQIVNEEIPALHGKDRQALVERKLEQHFPGQTLRLAITCGQTQAGREKLRLVALPTSATLTPWLDELRQQQSKISGIYSLSQLLGAALERHGKDSANCLLFMQCGNTLRQFFIRQGHVEFCRQRLSLPAEDLADETQRLHQYLQNQRLLEPSTPLAIYTFGPDAKITQATAADGEAPPLLFLDCLQRRLPAVQFADRTWRQTARCAYLQGAALLGSSLLSATCLLLSAANIEERAVLRATIAADQAQAHTLQQQMDSTNPPTNGVSPSLTDLHALIKEFEQLQASRQDPRTALLELSHVLDRHPAITMQSIDWHAPGQGQQLTLQGRISLHPQLNEADARQLLSNFSADLTQLPGRQVSQRSTLATPEQAGEALDFSIDIGSPT